MPLDKKFIQQAKKELEKEEARIKDELADFATKVKRGPSYAVIFPDYGDKSGENASEVASFNNNMSVKKVLESDLKDIQNVLKAIKNGTYGVCKYCRGDIGQPRMKARLTSSSCINCKKGFSK